MRADEVKKEKALRDELFTRETKLFQLSAVTRLRVAQTIKERELILYEMRFAEAAANADLSRLDLRGINLREFDFTGTDFSYSKLQDCDFALSNCERANFERAELENANFSHCTLKHARFDDAKLSKVDFSNADLSDSLLADADCSTAIFLQTKLVRCRMAGVKLNNARLYDAILTDADMREAIVDGASFSSAILPDGTRGDVSTDIWKFTDMSRSDFWAPQWVREFLTWLDSIGAKPYKKRGDPSLPNRKIEKAMEAKKVIEHYSQLDK